MSVSTAQPDPQPPFVPQPGAGPVPRSLGQILGDLDRPAAVPGGSDHSTPTPAAQTPAAQTPAAQTGAPGPAGPHAGMTPVAPPRTAPRTRATMNTTRFGPTGRALPDFPVPAPLDEHGPARVVALCNQKGGVGKTTTTINLGAAMAAYGRRVLLVDFDPQGSLSVGLGVDAHDLDLSVYNLLMQRGVRVEDVLHKTGVPGLDLIPSNIDLSAAEVQLVSEVAREQALARAIAPALLDYDVVLIDCQPSLGMLTVNALTASHGVIVPLECEYFALRGVALLQETIAKVQDRLNERLVLEGLLATMYDARTHHSREVLTRLVEAFDDRVFHTVVSRTVRFPETTVAGEPIISYAPDSPGAVAYRQLAREILARWDAG